MDSREFRQRGTEMVEFICKYLETLEDRRVTPSVEPGYLRHLLPEEAPFEPENWTDIMSDVESKIMPGVSTERKRINKLINTRTLKSHNFHTNKRF